MIAHKLELIKEELSVMEYWELVSMFEKRLAEVVVRDKKHLQMLPKMKGKKKSPKNMTVEFYHFFKM